MEKQDKRLDFSHFVDRLFWALITGAIFYGTQQLSEVNHSVQSLNEKMASAMEHQSDVDRRLNVQDGRLDRVERSLLKLKE